MSKDTKEILAMAIVYCIIVAIIYGFVFLAKNISCSHKASTMDLDYKYGPFIGCLVKLDGNWRPIESIRNIE